MTPQVLAISDLIMPFVTALIGGLVASIVTYKFGLKRDQEERRRERVIAHLIEAYRNIENSAGRSELTLEMTAKLESSIAAIFLLGSTASAKEANKLAVGGNSINGGDLTALLKSMRRDLRSELGLDTDDIELVFLRVPVKKR